MNSMTTLNSNRTCLLAGLLALVLVSGCRPAGPASATSEPVAAATPDREPNPDKAGALPAPVGKPGASVAMRHELSARPALGSPVDIAVSLTPGVATESMNVAVSTDEGLVLQSAAKLAFAAAAAGSASEATISVTPTAEGLSYVNVIVSMASSGRTQSRAFAIPIQVGDAVKRLEGKQATVDATGTAIVSMPAEETTGKAGKD